MKKKLFAILLSLTMVVIMMPVMTMMAYAEAVPDEGHDLIVLKGENKAALGEDYEWDTTDSNKLIIKKSDLTVTGNTTKEYIYCNEPVEYLTIEGLSITITQNNINALTFEKRATLDIIGTNSIQSIANAIETGGSLTLWGYDDGNLSVTSTSETAINSTNSLSLNCSGNITIKGNKKGIDAKEFIVPDNSGKVIVYGNNGEYGAIKSDTVDICGRFILTASTTYQANEATITEETFFDDANSRFTTTGSTAKSVLIVPPEDQIFYYGLDKNTNTLYLSSTQNAIIGKNLEAKEFNAIMKEVRVRGEVATYYYRTKWGPSADSIKKVVILNKMSPVITDYWFYKMTSLTEIDGIKNLNTSNVKSMYYMFYNCNALKSLDLSSFDTSKVSGMEYMFFNCNTLESLDLSSFDTSKVKNMYAMFSNCSSLESLDLSSFDTSKVRNIHSMFYNCNTLESLDLTNFDTKNVTNMESMFEECSGLKSLTLGSSFNTSKVSSMYDVFKNCKALESLDLSSFDTSNVTSMEEMFDGCEALKTLTLSSNFNTPKVQLMRRMFCNCKALESLDLSSFDTSNVITMYEMFSSCVSLESLDLSNFDTSNALSMNGIFQNCQVLKTLDISNFDTSKVTDMSCMFAACNNLATLDVSNFNTSSAKDMSTMFGDCYALTSLDVSNFNTANVTNMDYMFRGCTALKTLDLSNFDCTNVTKGNMFVHRIPSITYSYAITELKTPKNFNIEAKLPAVDSPMKWCYANNLFEYEDDYLPKQDTSTTLIAGIPIDKWTALQNAINATSGDATTPATKSTTFILSENITASAGANSITIPAGKNITINLNGHVLDRGLIANDGTGTDSYHGSVIEVAGKGTLNIIDSNADNKAYKFNVLESGLWKYAGEWGDGDTESDTVKKITGGVITGGKGNLVHAGGVTVGDFVEKGATFNMNGGTICGNMGADGKGGGVYVGDGNSFTMTDSSITGNTGGGAGGVCTDKANFTMINSSITNNKTTGSGGGADIDGGSFTMINSDISGNTAARDGGGVYCVGNATFTMMDSNITDNTAGAMAGGTFVRNSSIKMINSSITGNTASQMFGGALFTETNNVILGGTTVIKDNSAGETASNLTLLDAAITLGTKTASTEGNGVPTPAGDMHIGVTKSDETPQPTTGKITNNGTRNDAEYFFPDSADFYVNFVDDATDYLELKAKESLTQTLYWGYDGNTKTLYLSASADAITQKDTTANAFNSTKEYTFENNATPWGGFRTNIKQVEVLNDIAPGCAAYWFYSMRDLTEIKGIDHFDTANVTNMNRMFSECHALKSLDLSSLDTSIVTNMEEMFYLCDALESLDLSGFDTSNVTNMGSMFFGCTSLKSLDLSDFDTSNVTNMIEMFYDCTALESLEISNFNTSKATNMECMFRNCKALKSLDVSKFNTSSVESMKYMFDTCSELTSLNISDFDTSKVTNMESMFGSCSKLTSLDVSDFDTSKVTNMDLMFSGCNKLTLLDVSKFNTSKVTSMNKMFSTCKELKTLDLSNFDASKVESAKKMFFMAELMQIKTPRNLSANAPLPTTGIWYNANTLEAYTDNNLPKNLKRSITLIACAVSKDIENGTVTVQASGNSTVIVKVTPAEKHVLKEGSFKVIYNDGTGDKTITPTLTENSGEYSFTMPAYPVTVMAEFENLYGKHKHDELGFREWTSDSSLPDTADNYFLTKDVTLNSTWNVPSGTTNLCLNGHTIKFTSTEQYKINIDNVSEILTIYDCMDTEHKGYVDSEGVWHLGEGQGDTLNIKGGILTGSTQNVLVHVKAGKFTMTGGTICGNVGNNPGVFVEDKGGFTMNGGAIRNNKGTVRGAVGNNAGVITINDGQIIDNILTTNGSGGGVTLENGAILGIKGGKICGNKAPAEGTGAGGIFSKESSTVTMTGGTISGNVGHQIGGVYIHDGSFLMTGGTICDNEANGNTEASEHVGGIMINTNANVVFGGNAKIVRNFVTCPNGLPPDFKPYVITRNVFCKDKLSVGDGTMLSKPTGGMQVYVTTPSGVSQFSKNCSEDAAKYFFSDDENKYVKYDEINEYLVLQSIPQGSGKIKVNASENGVVYINPQVAASGESVTLIISADPGYAVDPESIKVLDKDRTEIDVSANADGTYTFTMPEGDVSIEAKFYLIIDTWAKLQEIIDSAKPGDTIILTEDLVAPADEDPIVINKDITIDLNGHILDRGLIASDGTPTTEEHGSVIELMGGELIIKDSNPSAVHDGYVDAKGIWHLAADGHPATSENAQKIKGGIITGGTGYHADEYFGGGIYANNGNITIEGGTIAGNLVQDNGGGIYTGSNCKLLMLDGSIKYNGTSKEGGCGGGINNLGDCTLRGGTITDNFSTCGGGVFNRDRLILEKISITGNEATYGGGIYNFYGNGVFSDAQIIVSGDAEITVKGNNSTQNDGHNIATDRPIIINATLTKAEMFVTFNDSNKDETTNGQLTSGYIDKNSDAEIDEFFHYDGPNTHYMDWNTSGNELVIKTVPDDKNAISIPSIPNGKITTDKQIAASGETVTITIISDVGYWHDPDNIKVTYNDGNEDKVITLTATQPEGTYTFTMPKAPVKINVEFEETIPTIKVKLSADATNPEFGTEYNEKLFNVQKKYFEDDQPDALVVEWKQDDGSWSSSDANRPRGVKIDSDGMVHVSADASAGAYTFRVTNGLASGDSQFVKSKEITLTIEQKPEETPASGEGYVIDYDKETLRASDDSYEVSTTSGEAATALSADGKINPGQTYYVRKKESDENHKPSEWVAIETPEKAEAPNAGDIPRSDFVTSADGIKLSADSKYEFSLSGDAPWTSAGDTITGLDDGTPYTVYVRIKASGDAFPSKALELEQIYTKFKAPSSSDAGRTKVDYTNEKYHLEDGYEISTSDGANFEDNQLEPDASGDVSIEPNTTYYIRKAAITSAEPEVPASDTFEFTTGGRQDAPEVNENDLVVTDTGITVPSGDGWEYMISGDGMPGEWTDENVFNNLDEATEYTIYVRTKASADADKFPSEKKEFIVFTEQTPPKSGEGYHVDWDAETIEVSGEAYEISTTSSDSGIFIGTISAEPGTTYYVRKKALTVPGDISASAWSEIKLPNRPETPNLQRSDFNVADTEITLTSGDGLEYRISCEAMVTDKWQDLDVIEGLSAGSTYTIIVRVKATERGFKSEESEITIKTKPKKPAEGEGFEIDFMNEKFSLSDDSLYEISTTSGDGVTALSCDSSGNGILEPGNTYYIRKKENTESSASAWQTIEVPNRPDAPTADELEGNGIDISVTKDSINIPSADGYEYRIDGEEWQDELNTGGLSAGSKHVIEIREKSKPGEFASEPLTKEVWTSKAEPASESEGEEINFQSEKFNIKNGYEISTTSGDSFEDGKLETDGSGNAALEPGTTYYLRKAGEPSGAPASEAIEFTTPSRPAAPENAPAIAETGENKITISAEAGMEYSIDGGRTWIRDNDGTGDTSADGQITFDNLQPGKTYTIQERTPADEYTFASEVSQTQVKTKGGSGGGGGGGSEETPSEEFKQPADEDGGGLPVNANIENGKATIEDIPKEDIEKAAGNVDGWNPEDDAIIIDLSNAGQKVNEVEIPTGTLEEIGKALDSGKNSVDKLTVKMTESEVELDRKAVKEIIGEAGGDKISLVAQPKQQSQLNEKQKESLTDQKVEKIIDTYIESGGNKIQDLGKGSAYITIDFSPLAGTNPEGYRVYELKPDGTLVDCNSRYDDGKLTFKTSSLSTYVILCAGTGDQVLLKATASGKKAVKLSWSRIPKATKYVVYGAKPKSKYKKIKTLSSKKAGCKIKKIKGKKLKAHKVYKFYVVAYNGNVKVKKSNAIHLITARKMKRFGNVKSIRVRNAKITLKIGQREKFKVKYKIYGNKKHLPAKYGIKTTFFTNDKDIVKISRTGWVTGLKAGTANVYIQDIGGKYCMATVTVEK